MQQDVTSDRAPVRACRAASATPPPRARARRPRAAPPAARARRGQARQRVARARGRGGRVVGASSPATNGAANDVPRTGANARVPRRPRPCRRPARRTSPAARARPRAAAAACRRRAPTPTTPGHEAGYSGGAAGPSLPTAATISMPCATARATSRCSIWFAGPTRLMLTTATCLRASHASSRAIASTEPPVGASQYASPAYSVARGSADWKCAAAPTISDATAVPCAAGCAPSSQPWRTRSRRAARGGARRRRCLSGRPHGARDGGATRDWRGDPAGGAHVPLPPYT